MCKKILVVCLIFFFTLYPVTSPVKDIEVNQATSPLFKTIDYKRPEVDKIIEDMDYTKTLMNEHYASQDVLASYQLNMEAIMQFDTMNTYMQILYNQDLNNKEYKEECQYLTDNYYKIDQQMNTLTSLMIDSSYKEAFEKEYSSTFIERFHESKKHNHEQLEQLIQKENILIQDYETASVYPYFVSFKGQEVTLDELDYTDPDVNTAYYQIYQQKNKACGDIYVELVKTRQEIAKLLGYSHYGEYSYESLNRDYTLEDAKRLSSQVKQVLSPLYITYKQRIKKTSTDYPTSTKALQILQNALETEFSSKMLEAYQFMLDQQLYIIDNQRSMKNAAFTTLLASYQAPFMFVNTQSFKDPSTLFHEFGHFYNYYCSPTLNWNDHNNLDLAEIHSQALELLMLPYYDYLYTNDAQYFKEKQILNALLSILQGCAEDEFSQAVYQLEDPTLEKINALHANIYNQYLGYPVELEWVDISHHFETPFYYISYATSSFSALEIWALSLENREQALQSYEKLNQYTFNCEYLNTLEEVGLSSPFQENQVNKIVEILKKNIDNSS